MKKIILIKYGELSTKGSNRNQFIDLLIANIKLLLKDEMNIIKKHDRIYIESSDLKKVKQQLQNIFGIQAIVIAYQVANDEEKIKAAVLKEIKDVKTFKIITKRANKNFPIKSSEFNNIIGSFVLKNNNLKVDVKNPEQAITIEIRDEASYIYSEEEKGLGGYPVGIQGKAVLMLSGGIDSPVAGFLSLKRGIDLTCLYFESPPHTNELAKQKIIDLVKELNKYSGKLKLIIVPFTKIQEAILEHVPSDYNITIMRRMMYRISEQICDLEAGKAIINGESIGQVASQTLDSIKVINAVTNKPVIRPVACFDKLEIIALAKKINTYDISIRPHQDCCTIFLAKHPVIYPKLEKCLNYEKTFDYQSLIEEVIANLAIIEINNKRSEWL